MTSTKSQRKRREAILEGYNEAKERLYSRSKNLDSFELRVERPTPSPPARGLSSLHLSCIQSLATIQAHPQLRQVFCVNWAGKSDAPDLEP